MGGVGGGASQEGLEWPPRGMEDVVLGVLEGEGGGFASLMESLRILAKTSFSLELLQSAESAGAGLATEPPFNKETPL